ncbi:OVARIAN TUMOR DOMAIN-containing deubiquitinating enzyme 7 isoform X2 [Gastrolobium bilobum]|uniref:OVARIAN TUMOR DOMAIN-containing deubiquitinating enzyme 7 isoform X2 n=1 Tax=Gastrolobium bilobum TaxID=150636 RepID=UPI002AB2C8EB|nr:OVARIAN TUMOR DOMAIN-containing deubiquitinating enzyme 7 isoform X2 [Gastrolobium bilobum]
MAKPKQQKKLSQKKQQHPQIKKLGKQADTSQFRTQLDALGLRIVEVTADGNCFFRALADQLEGNEEEHQKYRSMVVKHILDNRETFEPFIEDEVPFDEYCQSMENDGTWAGHMELQAASLVTHSNICIHRNMSPRWYIRNYDDSGVRMIHLSYHDGEHYNSVRLKDDPRDGPARSIVIKADGDLSAPSHQTKVVANKNRWQAGRETFQPGSMKLVMAGSGCESTEKVEQVLEQVNGDVGAAIEFLIAEQGTEDCPAKSDSFPSEANTYGCDKNENHEQHKEDMVEDSTNDESNNSSRKTDDNITLQPNDKIPRNKVCPCGSKKKYKACCGSSLGKQSAKFVVNQAADYRRGKTEKKLGKKRISAKTEVPCEYDSVTPDMGALCI